MQVQASVDNNASGSAEAFPVVANVSGQVTSISLFLDRSNTAATVWVGLYTDNDGHPRSLLTQAAMLNPIAGNWNTIAVPVVQVSQSKKYWIALLGTGGAVQFRDTNGSCSSESSRQTGLTALPGTWRTGAQWQTCVVSMAAIGTSGETVTVTVSPQATSLRTGQQLQFSAIVSGATNTSVSWSASGGTVSSSGMYTAPAAPGTYSVTATSLADSTKMASATVNVWLPSQVSVSVSPTSTSLQTNAKQQFTAFVSGTSNTAVTWTNSGGSITQSGLYTAPNIPGIYTITAVSAADRTKSASAKAIVTPTTVAVSVSPNTVVLPAGAQQQFVATVSGTTNTSVTWTVQGSGKITSSGLYTAPQTAEADVITVTSVADTTKTATASVTVAQTHLVSLSWQPSTSTNVASYDVYRGTIHGGPYSLIKSGVTSTEYTDSSVQPGATYYYVTTAVGTTGAESGFSNEAQAVIPNP